jgi:hypothetical protein
MKNFFISILLLEIMTSGISWAQPATRTLKGMVLPEPSGPHAVGTRFLYWEDTSRHDLMTDNPFDYRTISIQVWYPAQPEKGSLPMSYYPESVSSLFIEMGMLTKEFKSQVGDQPGHSFYEAPFLKGRNKFPVILFSSSFVMNGQVFLFENLASHGYVVLSIGHPHWCEFYFDGEGIVEFLDKEHDTYYQALWEEELSERVNQKKEALTMAKSVEEKQRILTELNQLMPLENQDIRYWVDDIGFVLDQLSYLNESESPYKGKMDLDQVGMMGYSKGGATAGQACLDEPRIKAGVNLSGIMFGDIDRKSLHVPFMVVENNEPWCKDCPPINDVLFYTSNSSVYMVQIDQAGHGNFTDLSALKSYLPGEGSGFLGEMDGNRFLEIEYDYVIQFFDRYLRGRRSTLLDGKNVRYPEVQFKVRHPDGL